MQDVRVGPERIDESVGKAVWISERRVEYAVGLRVK
jgi:hypothetical protein